jgi:hypothetical protein
LIVNEHLVRCQAQADLSEIGTTLGGTGGFAPPGAVYSEDGGTVSFGGSTTMALSRLAREFAAEIAHHDWSDAPWRTDRAGHRRSDDGPQRQTTQTLSDEESGRVRMNAMWVTAQVLIHADPNLDIYEFAEACGVPVRNSRGQVNRGIEYGLRRDPDGRYHQPGTRIVATESAS